MANERDRDRQQEELNRMWVVPNPNYGAPLRPPKIKREFQRSFASFRQSLKTSESHISPRYKLLLEEFAESSGISLVDRNGNVDQSAIGDSEKAQFQELLGKNLLAVAQAGNEVDLAELLDAGAPVNFQDRRSGATALHYIAGGAARPAFRVLSQASGLDYLVRDKAGRLAWELAAIAGDQALERLIAIKTRKQAEAQGIELFLRPKI